jgi:hypothetical protein
VLPAPISTLLLLEVALEPPLLPPLLLPPHPAARASTAPTPINHVSLRINPPVAFPLAFGVRAGCARAAPSPTRRVAFIIRRD